MTAYLIEHPPRTRQFRRPRRATPSGVIVVHTAEAPPDVIGPDTGAENVAAFIANRSDFGSYHDLADADSLINLVPYDAEAYHDGTGSNPHSYGVSAATEAARWPSLPPAWRDACVRNMARGAARYARWIEAEHGVTIPARRITREQSEARVPGFISHGERDPGRRTDPGPEFPWSTFLTYYAAELNPAPPKGLIDMAATPEQVAELQKAVRDTPIRINRETEAPHDVNLGALLAHLETEQDKIRRKLNELDGKLDQLLAKDKG